MTTPTLDSLTTGAAVQAYVANAIGPALGWCLERLGSSRYAMRHHCGAVVELPQRDEPTLRLRDRGDRDTTFKIAEEVRAALVCYCVPGPPPGWSPGDDCPATLGDLKRLRDELMALIRDEFAKLRRR